MSELTKTNVDLIIRFCKNCWSEGSKACSVCKIQPSRYSPITEEKS